MTAICVRRLALIIFVKGSKRFSNSVTTDVAVAFKETDKFFFLQKILKPKQVGYSTTEWNYKACLYPDLISALLLRATDVIR